MKQKVKNVQTCSKEGCKSRVGSKDSYFCDKHTYQRYHHVWFGNRAPVMTGDERTLGDLL